MNDEQLEQHLRALSAPELPESWRAGILASAQREARLAAPVRAHWPPLLVILRDLFARNPITAGVLATLWMLIFLFQATTPIDSTESNFIAHLDPKQPVYIVSVADEIRYVELAENGSTTQPRSMP